MDYKIVQMSIWDHFIGCFSGAKFVWNILEIFFISSKHLLMSLSMEYKIVQMSFWDHCIESFSGAKFMWNTFQIVYKFEAPIDVIMYGT